MIFRRWRYCRCLSKLTWCLLLRCLGKMLLLSFLVKYGYIVRLCCRLLISDLLLCGRM